MEQELRKEYLRKFAIADCDFSEQFDEIADFWLSKRKEELQGLIKEIERMKIKYESKNNEIEQHYFDCYMKWINENLNSTISLLQDKIGQ